MLSKRALNAFTEEASTTEFGKLFHIFTIRAEKSVYIDRSGKYGLEVYTLWGIKNTPKFFCA